VVENQIWQKIKKNIFVLNELFFPIINDMKIIKVKWKMVTS
jgi:hypothetical protein